MQTRVQCSKESCYATFDGRVPEVGTVRFCNRTGPDGGHASRWSGSQWEPVVHSMEHDRS